MRDVRRHLGRAALAAFVFIAAGHEASGQVLAQAAAPSAEPPDVSFIDRFTTLDSSHWYISNGWANGSHQNCTWSAANLKVDKGVQLYLTDQPSKDRAYTCAELQSRRFYGYGTFEVRMRAAPAPGTITAFFTYTGPPHGAGRPHDEIDIEILGKDLRGVFLNYFADGRRHEQTVDLGFDTSKEFHDYAFEWLPDSIRWYVDGKLVREAKRNPGQPFPTQKQKIYISIWNGIGWGQEVWAGRFAYPGSPLVASFEYIAFTRMGDACQFPSSIACRNAAVEKR